MASGPVSAVNSIVNAVFGIGKQVLGIVFNRSALQEEGKAQQDRAEAQKDVAKSEAKADKARAEAATQEARQKAARNS